MKKAFKILCIHGFGVRGFFWKTFADLARNRHHLVDTPDFAHASVPDAIIKVREYIKTALEETSDAAILVLGHSLGGILAALALRSLPESEGVTLCVLSVPYGTMHRGSLSPFQQFMFRHGLIPKWLLRRRFFGPSVPARDQKHLFDQAVPEAPELKSLLNEEYWFHNESVKTGTTLKGCAISFSGDRIVAPDQTARFAQEAGLDPVPWNSQEPWGHDDIGVSTALSEKLLDYLEFIMSQHSSGASG